MPRRRFINKKTAQNFHLVYRSQNDPRIHDPNAPDMVLAEVAAPNSHRTRGARKDDDHGENGSGRGGRVRSRSDLESEFGGQVRANEGEAAVHGIFYDDSEYNYMQHLRDMGACGDATFVPAQHNAAGRADKSKMKLEDMMANMGVGDNEGAAALFGDESAPLGLGQKSNYQDQQDVPDAIAGFQPNMDPRLREVLEALEDDAYIEDEADVFDELASNAQEVDQHTWEAMGSFLDDDGDGWASDGTVKANDKTELDAPSSTRAVSGVGVKLSPTEGVADMESGDHSDAKWMAEFSKFKKDSQARKVPKAAVDLQSLVTGASSVTGGRHKKRKGALTSTTNYSMTSSALARTEQLSLLDERFDKYERDYADDGYGADDNVSSISGISVYSKLSTSSQAPCPRSDFDSILEEFSAQNGRIKRGKKHNGFRDGLAQLDDIRKGLGPARV